MLSHILIILSASFFHADSAVSGMSTLRVQFIKLPKSKNQKTMLPEKKHREVFRDYTVSGYVM